MFRLLAWLRRESEFALSVLNFYLIGLPPLLVPRLYWAARYRRSDPWNYSSNPYELEKYAETLAALPPEREFERVLEVGCSEGVFTERLAEWGRAREIVGVDVAAAAVERSRSRLAGHRRVKLQHGDVLEMEGLGKFDLIFCAETLSHLGRYGRLVEMKERLFSMLAPGGLVVLVDAWPVARFLHRPFRGDPRLALQRERLVHHATRPYFIEVFQG